MTTFQESLAIGQAGEDVVARWLRRRGFTVLPVYEKLMDNKGGPRLFLPDRKLIAPDLLVWNNHVGFFVEVKHKQAFSWYREGACWVTGIDLRHYFDYLQIDEAGPPRVFLMFLHRGGQAKDSPPNSPTGLYGGWLKNLRTREDHRSPRHGPSGMVYWQEKNLKKIANLDALSLTKERVA